MLRHASATRDEVADRVLPRAPVQGMGVALVAAAGPLPEGGLERGVERVRRLGWHPMVGDNATARDGYLAGPDEGRARDLQRALDDPDVGMIWLLRGGYGSMRILPELDFRPLRDNPRPLIGYSDNTALHLAARRLGVVTFHGPHPAAPDVTDFSISSLLTVLRPEAAGTLPHPPEAAPVTTIVGGAAEGVLTGGNLSLLAATAGTPYQVETEGALLFIEEVGEPAYRIDRLLTQLLLAGVFAGVAGVVIGAISECSDADLPDRVDPREVVADRLSSLGVPVAYNFPFGHLPSSWTLPLGIRARLDATSGSLTLLEPAVEA